MLDRLAAAELEANISRDMWKGQIHGTLSRRPSVAIDTLAQFASLRDAVSKLLSALYKASE
jgi:hypothetical protein